MTLRVVLGLAVALAGGACAEPPQQEIDQAEGAIAAARAAGAEEFAAEDLAAASRALAQSQDAVAQGDYRSALNYALDSREGAQSAARQASVQRAVVRGQVEQAISDLKRLLERGRSSVAAAEQAGMPREPINRAKSELARTTNLVQEMGAEVEQGEYAATWRRLEGVQERTAAALEEIDALIRSGQPGRRQPVTGPREGVRRLPGQSPAGVADSATH